MNQASKAINVVRVKKHVAGKFVEHEDALAAEEPLEIRAVVHGNCQTLNVTMRTPGQDQELVLGWLLSEGIIANPNDVLDVRQADLDNTMLVTLQKEIVLETPARLYTTSSACGVCGSASIDALFQRGLKKIENHLEISPDFLCTLPKKLRASQETFEQTGGLHAAALFNSHGELLVVREDIGRHNAMDKIIGWAMQKNLLPLQEHVVLVSGRCGFEISQKAIVAGLPILCSVSAPSSLAVKLATEFGLTLVGFLRPPSFNVYTHPTRIV